MGRRELTRSRAVVGLLAAFSVFLSGCAHSVPTTATASSPRSVSGFRGAALAQPVPLTTTAAAAAFNSTSGTPTTLGAQQQGHLMILYFGYTHCPDECPTAMADLGQALRALPATVQARTQVVFITSDPARDTVPALRAWLGHFDVGLSRPFLGLTAAQHIIQRVADSVGVPLRPAVTNPDGSVTVEHGTQMLAFVNGRAPLVWLSGAGVDDYSHDIRLLLDTGQSD